MIVLDSPLELSRQRGNVFAIPIAAVSYRCHHRCRVVATRKANLESCGIERINSQEVIFPQYRRPAMMGFNRKDFQCGALRVSS